MGRYLEIIRRREIERGAYDKNDINDKSPPFGRFGRFVVPRKAEETPYFHALAALRGRCPDRVEPGRWQQAMADGERFLLQWAERAHALGWTTRDLFGLHEIPDRPSVNYRRLSRYDETGLIWLLQGRNVIELTEETAAIRWPSGSVTVYRRNNKPALGLMGAQ
jgi:hypothetical protein